MAQLTAVHEAARPLEMVDQKFRKPISQLTQPLLREYICNALILMRPRHIGQCEEG